MKEFRLLRADEIDVRVGSVSKTNGGVTLLLYKDARCDMAILDETLGVCGWQRHHSRDNANCIVSIWDEDKKMWIEKEDTGTESNTEAVKGLASDSFKRACFNLGIGRELYTAPFIFIQQGKFKDKYEKFYCTDIKYDGRKIKSVTILIDSTKEEITFYNKDIKPKTKTKVEVDKHSAPMSEEQDDYESAKKNLEDYPMSNQQGKEPCGKKLAKDIEKLCDEKGINKGVYLAKLKKDSFEELSVAQAISIINSLKGM